MRLTLAGLGHRFSAETWLFRQLDETLVAGHVYALTGPSGSGKSTLLGIIAGWIDPAAGSVEREGIRRTGWVFQSPHGVARRSVLDHVTLPLLARRASDATATGEALTLLDRFSLGHRAQSDFRELSGGEAQRLMLARALAADPDLLLVDEPTAQLDTATARTVSSAISRLADDNTIVVVATHDAATRDACSDHIDLARYAHSEETRT